MIDLIPLFAGVVLAQLAPGPNPLATAAATLGSGRRAGLGTAAGIAAGVFLWAVLFSLGMGALLDKAPAGLAALNLAGGLYLVWLGLRALRGSIAPRHRAAPAACTAPRPFRTGLAVVLTNPKAAMMWTAISIYLTGIGISGAAVLPVGLGVAGSALLVYGGYAWLFSTGSVTAAHAGFFRWIDGAFGTLFALLGVRLALDALRSLR